MEVLLKKLATQGWTNSFLQGDVQSKFGKIEEYEFYTNGIEYSDLFSSSVTGVDINLTIDDLARILDILLGGQSHYVKF